MTRSLLTITLLLALLCAVLLLTLVRIHLQLKRWAQDLEETEPGSNLRLTTSLRTPGFLRVIRAFNRRLSREQETAISQQKAADELKYTISCISHDIRTPLTGACGYLELLKSSGDSQKSTQYLDIIRRRLKDLEGLLDELFLYTKLTQEEYELNLSQIHPYPVLCDLLASFYNSIQSAGLSLSLSFPDETLSILANEEALYRVFSNLLKNAVSYGEGTLSIVQEDASITFSNDLPEGETPDVNSLFDRFYKADKSRHAKGSGLGLSIVRSLTEKMGGQVFASIREGALHITVSFSQIQAPPR